LNEPFLRTLRFAAVYRKVSREGPHPLITWGFGGESPHQNGMDWFFLSLFRIIIVATIVTTVLNVILYRDKSA